VLVWPVQLFQYQQWLSHDAQVCVSPFQCPASSVDAAFDPLPMTRSAVEALHCCCGKGSVPRAGDRALVRGGRWREVTRNKLISTVELMLLALLCLAFRDPAQAHGLLFMRTCVVTGITVHQRAVGLLLLISSAELRWGGRLLRTGSRVLMCGLGDWFL
jgi:hypothetical protein